MPDYFFLKGLGLFVRLAKACYPGEVNYTTLITPVATGIFLV